MARLMSAVLAIVMLSGCAAHVATQPQPLADDRLGAGVADAWYVPGKALACGGAALLSAVTMTVTFGLEYETASQIMHGGCSGPWVASPQVVRDGGSRY
jgi:hypothetical protein